MAKPEKCGLCEATETSVIYDGAMRSGGVGSDFVDGHHILECGVCGYIFLDPVSGDLKALYETDEFRKRFYNEVMVDANKAQLDREADVKIERIGIDAVAGRVVAEYGCGPGLFLDRVRDAAKETIGIEPTQAYHEILGRDGHKVFSYGDDEGLREIEVDVAVSFDAIEHVLDPKGFAGNIFSALKSGGVLYLSMPSHDDLLKSIRPDVYDSFNYQLAHLSYFTGAVAAELLEAASFRDVNVGYLHKYGIDNLLQWSVHGEPGAFEGAAAFDLDFDASYKAEIERMGIASHLFITARKA